jgi:carbonic anhydrase
VRFLVATAILLLSSHAVTAQGPSPSHAALGRLKVGNQRFVKNASAPVSLSVHTRQALTAGQSPFAMVLSCADSRVPPEYIFNAGLGELFVVRTAGEVMDKSILATLEYGAGHLHIPLMVVMGHESCGAVKAVVEDAPVSGPNLTYMLKAIKAGTSRTPSERMEIRSAILANVEQSINDALAGSAMLRSAVDSGALQIVGAYYEMASGRVTFSDPIGPADEAVVVTPRLITGPRPGTTPRPSAGQMPAAAPASPAAH